MLLQILTSIAVLLLLTNYRNHPDHKVGVERDPQHADDERDGVPAAAAVRHGVATRPVDGVRHIPTNQLEVI